MDIRNPYATEKKSLFTNEHCGTFDEIKNAHVTRYYGLLIAYEIESSLIDIREWNTIPTSA